MANFSLVDVVQRNFLLKEPFDFTRSFATTMTFRSNFNTERINTILSNSKLGYNLVVCHRPPKNFQAPSSSPPSQPLQFSFAHFAFIVRDFVNCSFVMYREVYQWPTTLRLNNTTKKIFNGRLVRKFCVTRTIELSVRFGIHLKLSSKVARNPLYLTPFIASHIAPHHHRHQNNHSSVATGLSPLLQFLLLSGNHQNQ